MSWFKFIEAMPETTQNADFTTVQFGAPEDAPEGMEDVVGIVILKKA